MEEREIRDLTISAVVLALAFAFHLTFRGQGEIITLFILSLATLSFSFVLHEMGHRYMAQKFGCYAEYKMWPKGLLIALILSPFILFAAPGAVMIHPRADLWGRTTPLSRQAYGLISAAGPLMNIILAGVFILLNLVYIVDPFLTVVFQIGAFINSILALFNLLPIPPLDGSKIMAWNVRVWGALFVPVIILYVLL